MINFLFPVLIDHLLWITISFWMMHVWMCWNELRARVPVYLGASWPPVCECLCVSSEEHRAFNKIGFVINRHLVQSISRIMSNLRYKYQCSMAAMTAVSI